MYYGDADLLSARQLFSCHLFCAFFSLLLLELQLAFVMENWLACECIIISGSHLRVFRMAVGGFFGIFIMFFTFMIHYPIAVITADLCNLLDAASQQQAQNNSSGVLNVLINCKNVPAIASLKSVADDAYAKSIDYGK
jgi:hypothetical protein